MTIQRRKFEKGIRLKATTDALSLDGEISNDSNDSRIKAHVEGSVREVVTADQTQTLTNKTVDADNNTVSNLEVDNLKAGVLNTDTSLAGASDTQVPSALAVKTYVDDSVAGKDDASEITYTPSTLTDWNGSADPGNTDAGLDQLASRVKVNEGDISTISGDLSTHTSATEAHGATGAVVGTTNTQTLTNKTLTDAKFNGVDSYNSEEVTATGVVSFLNPSQSVQFITGAVTEIQKITSASFSTNERIVLINASGADIVLKNEYSTNDGNQIKTGTNKDIKLKAEASLLLQYRGDGGTAHWYVVGGTGGGGATQFDITQTAHGFAVGEGIYHNGTNWVQGQANSASTLAYYVVIEVQDANNFTAADFGRIEAPSHGFTIGQYYFLSELSAGQPTTTEPTTGFSNPLFFVESADILQIKCYRPDAVGETLALDNLSDVSVPTPASNEFLKYNGAVWQPAKVEEQVISLTAAENLLIRDALYINGSGQVGKLDADLDSKIEFIGFARAAASATNPVEVVISGKLGGFSGLTAGEFVYADPANPGLVVQPEPTQANVYLIKVGKAISATEILVNPDLAASAEFNREVVANSTITNNQSTPAIISGLSFDGATYRAVVLRYSIYRVSDSEEYAQTGQLRLTYKTNAASWSISDDFGGDDAGVTFSVDATGQVLYTSTNVAGTGYSSSLKVNTVELFEI